MPGVGEAKAAQIKAAIELGKRSLASPLSKGMKIGSSRELFEHYHPTLRDLRHEIFKVVLLDAKHAIVRDATVSEGSLTLSIVHPREVFTMAMKESAAAVIFLHNHPSGDPSPSQEDHVLTARLVSAGELLGIRVLDHLVVGDGRYVSFADQGWFTTTQDRMSSEGANDHVMTWMHADGHASARRKEGPMNEPGARSLRNVAIIANRGAGKTSLAERSS